MLVLVRVIRMIKKNEIKIELLHFMNKAQVTCPAENPINCSQNRVMLARYYNKRRASPTRHNKPATSGHSQQALTALVSRLRRSSDTAYKQLWSQGNTADTARRLRGCSGCRNRPAGSNNTEKERRNHTQNSHNNHINIKARRTCNSCVNFEILFLKKCMKLSSPKEFNWFHIFHQDPQQCPLKCC